MKTMTARLRQPPLPQSRPLIPPRPPSRCKVDTLLVPIDFSAGSRKALEYALALKDEFGAQLHLVHVCDFDLAPSTYQAISLALTHGEMTRQWKLRLRDLAGESGIVLPPENLHVMTGRAYHEICQLADRLGVDLIITSTRGHTGLKHVLFGSTAERVVQHSPSAVLVVREGERDCLETDARHDRVFRLEKILVPLDFSECSTAGLEFAVPFAHFWKARLVLFHAVPVTTLSPDGPFGARDFTSYIDLQTPAENDLRAIASEMLGRGVAVETVVQSGPAARQICDYAETHQADLIITSTHGSTGFVHAVMGSTAEHVVRYAHCPVLVVPTRKRGESKT